MIIYFESDGTYLTERDSSEKGYLNTFNHITAQAFITSIYSKEMADFVADVHERKNMPELIYGNFTSDQLLNLDNNPVDNYVDLINNELGQTLGDLLRKKYNITYETEWTAELLVNYLNDIQLYYSRSFGIGMEPFRSQDEVVSKIIKKLIKVKGDVFHIARTLRGITMNQSVSFCETNVYFTMIQGTCVMSNTVNIISLKLGHY